MNDDDGSTTIILGALWEQAVSSNDGDERGPDFRSVRSDTRSPEIQISNLSDGEVSGSVLSLSGQSAESIEAQPDLNLVPTNAQTFAMSLKRRFSPAENMTKQFPSANRIKRRQPDSIHEMPSDSHTYALFKKHSDDNELVGFHPMHDTVVELLKNLRYEDTTNQKIDEDTLFLVENICEHLTRLDITNLKVNLKEPRQGVTVTIASSGRDFLLASLTDSELDNSMADLAKHLLHMLRFYGSQLPSGPVTPADDLPLQSEPTAREISSLSWSLDSGDSQTTKAISRRNGQTFPSELLDVLNGSGCTVPSMACV
jgi:hypothetical protein